MTAKEWLIRKKIPEEDISMYLSEDPLLILNSLLKHKTRPIIYAMDTTTIIENNFEKIQSFIKILETIPCLKDPKLQSIKTEKLSILLNPNHYRTIVRAFGSAFQQDSLAFILESLVNHTLKLTEHITKLILTYLDVRKTESPEVHILLSVFDGQRVSAANSHRIVDLLTHVCNALGLFKKYKNEINHLLKIKANCVRPEYVSAPFSSEASLEIALSSLRLVLEEGLQEETLQEDRALAVREQTAIIISEMDHLINFTAEVLYEATKIIKAQKALPGSHR